MGYTTDFAGSFRLDKPLTTAHAAYLVQFSETRRVKRDPERAARLPDPLRIAAGLPIGNDAGYFVGGVGEFGQDDDESVVDPNEPPDGQPGLWCGWTVGEDEQSIEWNGVEKFYNYVQWLEYLITHFLAPWGYTLNGEVRWEGEDEQDRGVIRVENDDVIAEPDY
jgi:hypothetical protein